MCVLLVVKRIAGKPAEQWLTYPRDYTAVTKQTTPHLKHSLCKVCNSLLAWIKIYAQKTQVGQVTV
ncbi:hypothetical protein [Cytobacillus stercorigallinarum]|uniref:hypothetical protein n=1 Tax=Cytobacillus stercorigallinarum TaxID=2762240 RepID=UPI001CD90A13|nr:hypothetical protein [Cytobacillus stercorigallinarum]